MSHRNGYTLLLLPDGGGKTRRLHLRGSRVRFLYGIGLVVCLLGVGFLVSWWYLAAQAYEATALRAEVEELRSERLQVGLLAQQLSEVEEEYERLRGMLGAGGSGSPEGGPALPASFGALDDGGAGGDADDGRPTAWPLTEPGFITQPLIEGPEEDHPGLDIAMPTGSYIRAAGPGRVKEVGDDPVYGRFVLLEHSEGYQTLYGHASVLVVEPGDQVRRREVIALTGSTGQSTAPHLHFEVRQNGEPVDPLTLVAPP